MTSDILANTAAQVGGQLLGGLGEQIGFGIGELTGYNKKIAKRQVEQQQKLTDQQVTAQKELAQNAKNLEYQQWLDTNYPAQVQQLKEAGLNPALVYGSAGEGGTTGAGGQGSATGGTASDETSRKLANQGTTGLGIQLRKAEAEIANIEADTEKKKGVDTEKTKTEIKNIENATALIAEQTNSEVIKRQGLELQNEFQKITNKIKEATKEDEIRTIFENWRKVRSETAKLNNEIQGLLVDNEIKNEAKSEIVKAYKLENERIATDIILKRSQKNVNDAEVRSQITKIQQEWEKIAQKYKDQEIDEKKIEASIESSKIMKSAIIWSASIGAGKEVMKDVIKVLAPF